MYDLLLVETNLAANFSEEGWQGAEELFPEWLQLVQRGKTGQKKFFNSVPFNQE